MGSGKNKDKKDQGKSKTTWGNIVPGERTDSEQSALGHAEANAEHADCDHVSSTNMDPAPREGSEEGSEKDQEWQQLSKEEKKRPDNRKGGYPKN